MESLKDKIIKKILEREGVSKKTIGEINEKSSNFNEFRDNLIKSNIVSEEDILLILSREYGLPYLDLDKYRVSLENKNLLTKELSFRYKVLAISRIGDVLTLAISNPLDVVALDDLRLAISFKKIGFVLAKESKIVAALNSLYSEAEMTPFLEEETEDDDSVKEVISSEDMGLETLVKESKLPPVVRVVDLLIYEGLRRRASDIHIEPTEKGLSARYRIDGVLQHGLALPKRNRNAVLARLKIMSSLNITEFRIPQDGRFKVKFQDREIDFRVSSLPTNFGEKIVLRILDRKSLSVGVKKLGFSDAPLKLFEQALAAPFGIILVTGPTGSGKSTTLYSVINQINSPERNIITIENPVEYELEGITQIQVRQEVGLTFSSSLRSVLRQSPDIIMIGEIRDSETADIAIKASLTGQLIFSTLHTNNSVGSITRLVDMGIEPFLVSSSLIASTAQRLVRKLCLKCRAKEEIDKELLKRIDFDSSRAQFYKPAGCSYCNGTGYRGRIAILEVLSFDDIIREMVIKRKPESQIVDYAKANREFIYLKLDGFKKCVEGITSLEEVLRVAG